MSICKSFLIWTIALGFLDISTTFSCVHSFVFPLNICKDYLQSKSTIGSFESKQQFSTGRRNAARGIIHQRSQLNSRMQLLEEQARQDKIHMTRAIDLAKKGLGKTYPNPCVGCVLVKDERVVGEGFHPRAGMPHAEVRFNKFSRTSSVE